MKKCSKCGIEKSLDQFYSGRSDCKPCKRLNSKQVYHKDPQERKRVHSIWVGANKQYLKDYHAANARLNRARKNKNESSRRCRKLMATPLWAETEKINQVYAKAKDLGFTVDHIVPLSNKLVCGLHVWSNLQLLSKSENSAKCNYYWPDMPEERRER